MKVVIYKDHIIKRSKHNKKFCGYNYKTDKFINPLYDTMEDLMLAIDNLKK